jgi:hypothetical protein
MSREQALFLANDEGMSNVLIKFWVERYEPPRPPREPQRLSA